MQAFHTNPSAGEMLASVFEKNIQLPKRAVVAAYWPVGEEMDVRPLMQALAAGGHPLALPVVIAKGQRLQFRNYSHGMTLETGVWNIPVPPVDAGVVEPDIVLVPLLAFDSAGNRLGYGGGFYDKTVAWLKAHKPIRTLGIGFDCQRVDAVPVGGRDEKLDDVVTEITHYLFK